MRVYTELVIVDAKNYRQILESATDHWRFLNEDATLALPQDTEIKVRNGDYVDNLPTYTGYVTIRSKAE